MAKTEFELFEEWAVSYTRIHQIAAKALRKVRARLLKLGAAWAKRI